MSTEFDIQQNSSAKIPIKTRWRRRTQTHKVKTLFHSGLRFLYTVCVCSRSLFNSSTQNGSLLPGKVGHAALARARTGGHLVAAFSSYRSRRQPWDPRLSSPSPARCPRPSGWRGSAVGAAEEVTHRHFHWLKEDVFPTPASWQLGQKTNSDSGPGWQNYFGKSTDTCG